MPDHAGGTWQQAQAGNQAVIIQVGGNAGNITVGADRPALWLDPRDRSTTTPTERAAHLIPDYRFLHCIGREDVLQRLQAWLDDPKPLSVRAIIGDGGRGKTRLAMELCHQAGEEWHAGFVPDGALKRLYEQHDPATWRWLGPTLVVVDYAARVTDLLRRWLLALEKMSQGTEAPKLRILLLERHGQTGGGWWKSLFHQGSWEDETLNRLLPDPEPEKLQPLTTEHRLALFIHAVGRYGGSGEALQANALLQQRLEHTDWAGDPLYLAMAAQVAVEQNAEDALSLSRAELAFRIAERERKHLLSHVPNNNRDQTRLLPHLAAMLTLCQGLDRTRLMAVIEHEKEVLGYSDAGGRGTLADLLSEALPSETEGEAAFIRPDMIGEAFILQELRQPDQAVLRAFHVAGIDVAATIIHCVQDFALEGRKEPLAWLDGLLAQTEISTEDLWKIANLIPQSSVTLMEHAVRIYADIESRLRKDISSHGRADAIPFLAGTLNNLAVSLAAMGRREEALQQAQEAVKITRELAAARPEAFRPDLAMSLNNLANSLSELGRREEALQQAQEAVKIYRELAAARP
ncbi:MAG: tetratricopeptide repeat protein, partial [Magnetococcus sp. THC-1_WYH]